MTNPERPAPDHIKIVEDNLKRRPDMRGFAESNPAVVDRLGQIVRWVDANLRAAGYKLSLEEIAPREDEGWETRFGLTPAEARLAAHLLDGGTPASYAQSQGLSPHTVRNHLRSIYAKTNTNRQVSLLQLLLRTSGKNP
jgi:DNA-binding CsgD family transcriptional regulator